MKRYLNAAKMIELATNPLTWLVIIIILQIYYQRWAFLEPFDYKYLQDLYDHSQWNIPQSVRTLGDDGRYELAGYHLIRGGELYKIAAEVPPLGEYLIGVSILLFNNAKILNICWYFAALVIFFLLTRFFIAHQKYRNTALLIFASTPALTSQLSTVMLDLPQMVILLVHIYFLFRLVNCDRKNWQNAVFSGIAAGLFISYKFGVFFVPVLIADALLLYQARKIKYFVAIILPIPAVYFISTIRFFFSQGGINQYITAQKWVLNFYRQSNSGFVPGMALITLFTSYFKGWWGNTVETWKFWSAVFPLGFVGLILYRIKHNDTYSNYLLSFLILMLSLFSFTAFWPRYLLLLLPFVVIGTIKIIENTNVHKLVSYFFFALLFFQSANSLFTQPSETLNVFKKEWQNTTYQEAYGLFDRSLTASLNRNQYWRELLAIDRQIFLTKRAVEYETPFTYPWTNQITTNLKITLYTEIGDIKFSKKINAHHINNQWKLTWDWGIVLPEYQKDDQILSQFKYGYDGVLKTSNGTILSQTATRPFINILPYKLQDEVAVTKEISILTGLQGFQIASKFLGNQPFDQPAPIGFAKPDYPIASLEKIKNNPGIIIDYPRARSYNRDLIDQGKYNQIKSLEDRYFSQIFAVTGGTVKIVKKNSREMILIDKKYTDGRDVVVDTL